MTVMGDEALVGRLLDDRYHIEERIARGGMASVFRATDQRLDRTVAVKVMHHGLGDDRQFTERFVREAKSAAKLNHRNVVSVFDQGTDGEVTYLVMEYVPGRTLRDVMREEAPMPPPRALALVEQVLIALSAAHAAHIVHRDVKPENVLITPDGDVKVADFGLARAVSAATTATGGTLIGTVSYLAPELVVNEGADARSDVYACGAMLFEMLTGAKPHTGDSPIQVAYKHVHEDVAPPSSIVAGVPPYLDALVMRTTARHRDQRSADARVMLQQLRMVQRALDAGVEDDADLTADLLPRPHAEQGSDDSSPTQRIAAAHLTAALGAQDGEPTELMTVADASEPTVQWSSGPSTQPHSSGLHPPMSADDYKKSQPAPKHRHTGRILLVAALLLAVLAAALGWYIGVGRYVDTPQLVGLSQAQAAEEAKAAGFELKVTDEVYSETAPAGTVVSTDPEPGERILRDTVINTVVSKGKERYEIPDLRDKSVKDATAQLKDLRLVLGDTTEAFDDTIAAGNIIKITDFEPGDQVKRNTKVDVVVSKGREPIAVKDFTGESEDAAMGGLSAAGFKVAVERAFSEDVDAGTVMRQTPYEGSKFKGDTITITVSRGPERIKVPDVVDKKRSEAEDVLKDAGFKVRAVGDGDFTVRLQNPGADSKQKRGATVTILGF